MEIMLEHLCGNIYLHNEHNIRENDERISKQNR